MSFFSKVFDRNKVKTGEIDPQLVEKLKKQARTLIPLNELTEDGFNKCLAIAEFKTYANKETLFSIGDTDDKTIYLLDGSVDMVSEDHKEKNVSSSHPSAFYPLANLKPRCYTASASGDVVVAVFPSEELDRIVHWDQVAMMESMSNIEVHDASEDGSDLSWIFHMTNSPAISQFPASNVESLFKAFKPVKSPKGKTIIKQGETGNSYYVIAEGSCEVLRKHPDGRVDQVTLEAGETFGEEALLSNLPRNATVIMGSDGLLMKLSKVDFNRLLKSKILNWVEPSDVLKETYIFVDVRSESEFQNDGLENSINLPLQFIRQRSDELEQGQKYMVYCDNGSRSSSAAYLLADRGFDVSIIKGGLTAFLDKGDQRLSKAPIPHDWEKMLTKEQLLAIQKIESYGGGLWFIRQPIFGDVVPMVRFSSKDGSQTAVVESDGTLNKEHGLTIRG